MFHYKNQLNTKEESDAENKEQKSYKAQKKNNSEMTKASLSLSVVPLVVCKWISPPIKRQGLAEWIFFQQ